MAPKTGKREKAFEYNPAVDLKPGRHRCECQARIHELIRNCLNCGRVVCKQEGSGACFFCGHLVCTREESALIKSGTKRGNALLAKLMGNASEGPSLKSVAANLDNAIAYRDKLLQADADSERRNKVKDLEADYLNLESSAYLTVEEREAILQRKAELRQMRMSVKKRVVVDFDFASCQVSEQKEGPIEVAADPVLQAILKQSQMRMREEAIARSVNAPTNRLQCDDFVPKYDSSSSSIKDIPNVETPQIEGLFGENDEELFAEIEQQGYCLVVDQPYATFVVNGLRRHIPLMEDLRFTGPMLIAATTTTLSAQIAKSEEKKAIARFPTSSISFPTEYPCGSILGRVFVEDCITAQEYNHKFSKGAECQPKSGFVLLVSHGEALPNPIPHIPPSEFYQVNASLRRTVKDLLDPYVVV